MGFILLTTLSKQHIFNINLFIYLFIFGCAGSSLLCAGFLYLWRAGAPLRCGARASHGSGFSCCGAQPEKSLEPFPQLSHLQGFSPV